MQHAAVLLAGGSGTRMGGVGEDKILFDIGGRSVFGHVLRTFVDSGLFGRLVIVHRDEQQRRHLEKALAREGVPLPVSFRGGGRRRQDSVRSGLSALPREVHWVWIHDCARPAIRRESLQLLAEALHPRAGAVGMAHRVTDTVRRFGESPLAQPSRGELLDREFLWAMETPQVFPKDLLLRAHDALGTEVTDDLAAVEALGEPVLLVENPFPNPKLTAPADLPHITSLLQEQPMDKPGPSSRVGIGYDIHRLEEGRPLVLGGVEIPSGKGLVGHSDADVLSHAMADAILGAAGLADIGHYFPNTDPAIAGISSLRILERAVAEAREAGWRLGNVDATLIAEKPKIAPYLAGMRSKLAGALALPENAVGIKATTNEGLGSLGRGEGMAAHAVAYLYPVGD